MAERKPASSITLPTAIDFDTAELALLISEGVRNVQIRYMRNERRQSASGPKPLGRYQRELPVAKAPHIGHSGCRYAILKAAIRYLPRPTPAEEKDNGIF